MDPLTVGDQPIKALYYYKFNVNFVSSLQHEYLDCIDIFSFNLDTIKMTRFVVGNKLRQDFENGRSATRPTAAANMSQKHSQNTPPKIFGEKPKPLTDAEFSVKIAKIAKIKFKGRNILEPR